MSVTPSLAKRLWSVGWAPLGVIALHSGLAAAIGHKREYDPGFHFLGGAAGAYCLLRAIRVFRAGFGWLKSFNPVLVVLVVMVAITGLWEVAELTSDRVLGTRVQLGRGDTAMDVLLGIVGALFVVTVAALVDRTDRRSSSHVV